MPAHWTYVDPGVDATLHQGDILEPTDELQKLLQEVHPHFCQPKYRGFMIVSQTCDLVHKKCPHISLCVVRSLAELLEGALSSASGRLAAGIFAADLKQQTHQLIERIVNQNEQAQGLFYLYPDLDVGVSVHSAAILRVAIALRNQHYDLLVRARRGRLTPAFQAKVGWMIANLYGRVGVPDWKEQGPGREDELRNEILTLDCDRTEPLWVKRKVFQNAIKRNPDLVKLTEEEIAEVLQRSAPPPAAQNVFSRVLNVVKKTIPDLPEPDVERLKMALTNDLALKDQLKRLDG